MELIHTLPDHLRNPEVPYATHVQLKSVALGESIASATKVYLDTKFWIYLRDARLGRSNDSDVISLLGILTRLVASGRVICPLSMEIFREIFRQSDTVTLTASVQLIDLLSRGVCLLDQFSRIGAETTHFMRQVTKGQDKVHPLKHLVWTKTAYVLGHVRPTFSDAKMKAQGIDMAFQKAFCDQMWQTTLSDFLVVSNGEFRLPDSSDISSALNDGKFANVHDRTSFGDLFLIEVNGFLDACRPIFADVMHNIYRQDTGNTPTAEEMAANKSGDHVANLIYQCFRHEKRAGQLPTIRMEASLHAAVRWDTARKFKRNDCADFRHASAAIPYFDYFLTERSLNQLLSDGNLKLRDYFNCVVVPDVSGAIRALASLES
jgi:hypothetical protein